MNRTTRIFVVAMLGVLVTSAPAQEPPDFSGQWTTDPDPTAAGADENPQRGAARQGRGRRGGRRGAPRTGDMGSGWGANIAISTDASIVTVEYAFFARGDLQPPLKFTYAIGGETTNSVMMGRGIQKQMSIAEWDDGALVIATTHTFEHPGTGEVLTCDVTRTLSLDDAGRLIVEVTRGGVLGGDATTTRTVYRRRDAGPRGAG